MKRLRAWTGLAALLVLVLVPACGGSAPAAPRGTVTGRLQIEGRTSAGQGRRPIPATVRFTGAHQQRVVVESAAREPSGSG